MKDHPPRTPDSMLPKGFFETIVFRDPSKVQLPGQDMLRVDRVIRGVLPAQAGG